MISFELTDDDVEKIKKFHPKCKNKYTGAIGGGNEYIFMPTSIGTFKRYKCKCGKFLELSDTENW